MPRDLADPRVAENGKSYQVAYGISEYQRVGWCQPPKDYQKWYDLIFTLVTHLKNRYGARELETWYFEMWNEPDIFYWRGSVEEFCKLYDYTEAAVHKALPSARFGGPATCGAREPDARATVFLDAFLHHVRNGENRYSGEKGSPLTLPPSIPGRRLPLRYAGEKADTPVQALLANVETQCAVIRKYGYERWNASLSEADPDGWAAGGRFYNFNLNFRNTNYYASYVMSSYKKLYDVAQKLGMDIRPLAWAFMFEAERCFEGTRTFTTQGIDKAVFNLFKLFARMGSQRVALTSPVTWIRCALRMKTERPKARDRRLGDDGRRNALQTLLYATTTIGPARNV
jgi:xylan 1,4-beta-xylosidase